MLLAPSSQRSRRLSYLKPCGYHAFLACIGTAFPLTTRHPHDDCLCLSRLTRIYVFASFISRGVHPTSWFGDSLWNMALPLTRCRLGRSLWPMLPTQLSASPHDASSPIFLRGAAAYLMQCLWVPCLPRLYWHPLLAILTTTACTYPASYAFHLPFPFTFLLVLALPVGRPRPCPAAESVWFRCRSSLGASILHPTSWFGDSVVEYGPAPDTLPARPIVVADASHPAISLAARRVQPHLSQRSRRLYYLMPLGTMPSSPVLAPVTRHPHDDCLHLSRLTRIYIFLSFISSLGTFILEVVWGTLSLWNMALPLTRSRLGRLVLPSLPSVQPRRPMLLAPSFSEEPPLILSKALWVPCLSRLHWHGLPAYNSPSSRRLPVLIPPHTHLRLRVIHLSGRSSYKLVWGLVVEYGPAPDTLPARPIVAADASQLAASPPGASSPIFLSEAAAYLISCFCLHFFLARMCTAFPLSTRQPHDARRLPALIPPHTHLHLPVVHLSGRSSYKSFGGLTLW